MRTVLIILSVLIWAAHVFGQVGNQSETKDVGYEVAKLNSLNQNQGNKYLEEKDIAGTPFFDKQFQKSYILKTNGVEIKDIFLRYNLYNNNMEFKKDGKILSIAFPSEIQRINMGGKIFIHARYLKPKKVDYGFFQVLYEGDYQLLKKDQVVLKSPSDKTNQNDSLRFEKLPPEFYLLYGNGMAHLVYSQKTLIKVLQPIPQNVIDYIKSNKINTKDENQLIDLMKYMADTPN